MIYALDASVVLAVLFDEPGGCDAVDQVSDGLMSSVNYSEVIARCLERGVASDLAERQLGRLNFDIVPFSPAEARIAAELREATRHRGLSLGDRACLALAHHRGVPALTADRQWDGLDLDVEIRLIR